MPLQFMVTLLILSMQQEVAEGGVDSMTGKGGEGTGCCTLSLRLFMAASLKIFFGSNIHVGLRCDVTGYMS